MSAGGLPPFWGAWTGKARSPAARPRAPRDNDLMNTCPATFDLQGVAPPRCGCSGVHRPAAREPCSEIPGVSSLQTVLRQPRGPAQAWRGHCGSPCTAGVLAWPLRVPRACMCTAASPGQTGLLAGRVIGPPFQMRGLRLGAVWGQTRPRSRGRGQPGLGVPLPSPCTSGRGIRWVWAPVLPPPLPGATWSFHPHL